MSLLSHGPVEKIILIKGLGYPNISAFEYDLAYLRKEFNADISYDRRTKSYCIKDDRGTPSGAVYTYKKKWINSYIQCQNTEYKLTSKNMLIMSNDIDILTYDYLTN